MNAETPPKTGTGIPAQAITPPTPTPPIRARRSRRVFVMLFLPLVLIIGGGIYWLNGGRYETTENANLHRVRISIASDLPGRVVSVAIRDNMPVHADDVLFQVDPELFRLKLAAAEAALAQARLQVAQLKAALAQARLRAKLARDDAAYQRSELARIEKLAKKGVATTTALDNARHRARRAEEQRAVAEQGVTNALAALGGDPNDDTDRHPLVRSALVARDRAAYDLERTTVKAPIDGVIYKAADFRPGQFVAAGQRLFSLVGTTDAWVDANFKETQLDGIRVGQPAEVILDAARDHPVSAHVAAVGAGTGAEFSLLPAQNATGNWIKVTQRVPVRLALDDPEAVAGMASGLSAKVSVDTGRRRSLSWPITVAPKSGR